MNIAYLCSRWHLVEACVFVALMLCIFAFGGAWYLFWGMAAKSL